MKTNDPRLQELPKPEKHPERPGKNIPDTPHLPPDKPELIPPEKPQGNPPAEVPAPGKNNIYF